jgi:O-antigen ligase
MGLWLLLWLGYNDGPTSLLDPDFPANTTALIHGVRAYFPMLAAWIAFLVIFTRINRVSSWILGPLGLMLFYAIIALISSAILSPAPTDALYYGANYLAIVLVLLAIVTVDDPLPDVRQVLELTWFVGTILTLSMLGAIPFLGSSEIAETESSPMGIRAYNGSGTVMGMPSTRNTGFARYAAISALVALPGLMRKGRLSVRIIWGISFTASVYALIIANGRTETLAFVGGMAVIFFVEKAKRFTYFLVGIAAAIILGIRGFFSGFFLYITRTGHVDTTMTGRTATWSDGLHLLWESPWVGFGFQADRYLLGGHMHNAFIHVLIQSGLLGGGAILLGIGIVWSYLIKYFFLDQPPDKSLIPPEIPAVFLFVTISSIAESTFAYYSAAWLLSAPIVAYVMALHLRLQMISAKTVQERVMQARLART